MARQDADIKRRKTSKPTQNGNGFQDFEFVEMRLDASDKAQFQAYVSSSADELWDDLYTLIQAGYKLSVSYMDNNDCFIASLTCRSDGDPNYNRVLSSRSDSFIDAVLLGVYKTTVLCKDNHWPTTPAVNNWG